MVWIRNDLKNHLVPPPQIWTGIPFTRPCCLGPHPIWPRTLPGIGHNPNLYQHKIWNLLFTRMSWCLNLRSPGGLELHFFLFYLCPDVATLCYFLQNRKWHWANKIIQWKECDQKKKTFLSAGQFQVGTNRHKTPSRCFISNLQRKEAVFTRRKEPTCSCSSGWKQSDVFGAILFHWSCRYFIFFFPPFIWHKESYRATLGRKTPERK